MVRKWRLGAKLIQKKFNTEAYRMWDKKGLCKGFGVKRIKVNCSISPNLYVQANPPSQIYPKSLFLALTSSGLFFLHFQMFLKIMT